MRKHKPETVARIRAAALAAERRAARLGVDAERVTAEQIDADLDALIQAAGTWATDEGGVVDETSRLTKTLQQSCKSKAGGVYAPRDE